MPRLRAVLTGLAGLVLLCGLCAGCGTATRARLSMLDFQDARPTAEAWARFRGREPTLNAFWIKSALADPERGEFAVTPEQSLALLEQARTFIPDDVDVLLVMLSHLLANPELRDLDQAVDVARSELDHGVDVTRRDLLCRVLATAYIELGRLDEARDAILRAGGLLTADPSAISNLWALHARESMRLGRVDESDASFDLSLARGPGGLWALYGNDLAPDPRQPTPPPERAATRQVVTRAVARHPRHVDLAFVAALDTIHQGDFAGGEQQLLELPEPVPERLLGRLAGVRAEVVIAQGRLGEGVELLLGYLDEHPVDLDVLQELSAIHQMHDVPDAETVKDRLWAAYIHADRNTQLVLQRMASAMNGAEAPSDDTPTP
ncbi:MAG: hypothetical protein H6825_14240 [Planctomycetes bacterium]|nr:hypothetical protein [Planctomycetota bacterium]